MHTFKNGIEFLQSFFSFYFFLHYFFSLYFCLVYFLFARLFVLDLFSILRLDNFLFLGDLSLLIDLEKMRLLIFLGDDYVLIFLLLVGISSFEGLSLFDSKILVMNVLCTGFRYEWIFRNCWNLTKIKLLIRFVILNDTDWNLTLGFDITIEHIKIYRLFITIITRKGFNNMLCHNMFRSVSQNIIWQKLLHLKLIVKLKVLTSIFWRWWWIFLLKWWIWLFTVI